MGSKLGVLKIAAKRIGISFDIYMNIKALGLERCTVGKHWCPPSDFNRNRSRSNGLAQSCRYCLKQEGAPPFPAEKIEKLAVGLKWCSGCKQWLSSDQVLRNRCRPCLNKYAREHYATNKRYRQERRQHAHSRKRGIEPISPEIQDAAMMSTNGLCKYCDAPATTFDHVIPVSKGGGSGLDNIVPACSSCNSSKKNRDLDEWFASR